MPDFSVPSFTFIHGIYRARGGVTVCGRSPAVAAVILYVHRNTLHPSSNSSGLRALLMNAQSEGTFASFEGLPYELFTAVLCYLPVTSLGALSCTSKVWKERVESCVDAWKYHFVAFFGNTPRNKKTEEGHWSLDNLPWRTFTISEINTMRSKKNATTLLFWGTIKG